MAVEVTISHVIEKMKYLQDRNEIMNLSSLKTGVDGSMEILKEKFLKSLKDVNDSGGNSLEIGGCKTEDLKNLLYSTEDEIDSFLVKTALAKASPVLYVKSLSNQFFLSNKMNKFLCELKKMSEEMENNRATQQESSSNPNDMGDGPADSSGNNMVDPQPRQPEIENDFENTSGVEQPDQQQGILPSSSSKDMRDRPADSSGNNLGDSQPRQLEANQQQVEPAIEALPSSNNLSDAVSKGKDLVDGASDPKVSKNMTTDLSNREIVEMETSEKKAKTRKPSQRLKSGIRKVIAVNRFQTGEKFVGMKDKIEELARLTLNRYTTYFPISVVGRAGSGKTLLVRQIFDHSQTRRNFDKFAFVSISQNFKERDVLAEILQQVAGVKDHNESSSEELKKKLGFFLARKRYLIVLDDVHKADVWNKLKLAFQNPLKGSRVILTIRDVNVARRIAPTVVLLHLRPLTDEESWRLFLKSLRKDQLDSPDDHKEQTSKNCEGLPLQILVLKKQILENCEGLPLQILVLGGLLASKPLTEWSKLLKQIKTRKEGKKRVDKTEQKMKVTDRHPEQDTQRKKVSGQRFEQVRQGKQEKKKGEIAAAGDDYQPSSSDQSSSEGAADSVILDLGIQELDSTLKACFYYLCLFPKSGKVRTRKLFRLWVAEGLVTSADKSAEAVVEEYLKNLESRNMIEVAELRSDGMAKTCQVPTALYDKFISNAEQELGYHHVASTSDSTSNSSEINIRKLSVFSNVRGPLDRYKCNIEKVRSYICFDKQRGDKPAEEVGNFIKKILDARGFGLMTVLDLEGVYKPHLPKTLGKVLPLLKFVGLRGTLLDSIPDSIGDLHFLETLDVKHTNIPRLPISVWSAQELQHLYMNENHFEDSNPESSSICYLSSYPTSSCYPSKLQTLCGLLIGNNNPPVEWLKKLTGLRKVGLTCHTQSLGKIIEWIVGVSKLQTFKLRAINEFFEPSDIIDLGSMNKLTELTNLYLLGKLPRDINTTQLPPNIKILTLSVSQLSDDPMELLGELKELKVLRLLAHSYIGENMTCPRKGFGKLQVLNLWMLRELKEWTIEQEAMPKLTQLEIRHCRRLSKLDGLEKLVSLKRVTLTNMEQAFVDQVKSWLGSRQDISIDNPNYSFYPSWD